MKLLEALGKKQYHHDDRKLIKLAMLFRQKMEKKCGVRMEHKCGEVSEDLAKFLIKNGYPAETVWGNYCGADLDYVPNIKPWLKQEDFDAEDFWDSYEAAKDKGKALCYAHWWVQVGRTIVDITASQFHPKRQEEFKVVVTSSHKNYN